MPYADPERQRQAKRASEARIRAARRAAASASRAHAHAREDVSNSQHPIAPPHTVGSAHTEPTEPAEPVTEADIFEVARMLNMRMAMNEDLAGFRRRLRQRGALIRRVMAGGDG